MLHIGRIGVGDIASTVFASGVLWGSKCSFDLLFAAFVEEFLANFRWCARKCLFEHFDALVFQSEICKFVVVFGGSLVDTLEVDIESCLLICRQILVVHQNIAQALSVAFLIGLVEFCDLLFVHCRKRIAQIFFTVGVRACAPAPLFVFF